MTTNEEKTTPEGAVAAGSVAESIEARRARWLQENAAAIQSYNEFVEKHGMVLERYREWQPFEHE